MKTFGGSWVVVCRAWNYVSIHRPVASPKFSPRGSHSGYAQMHSTADMPGNRACHSRTQGGDAAQVWCEVLLSWECHSPAEQHQSCCACTSEGTGPSYQHCYTKITKLIFLLCNSGYCGRWFPGAVRQRALGSHSGHQAA